MVMFMNQLKNWFQRLRMWFLKKKNFEFKITLKHRHYQLKIGIPWTVWWPKKYPIPEIGDIIMLPSPPFVIGNSQIPVIVSQRALYLQIQSADIYVYELFPEENWNKIARLVRNGDL